MVELPASRTLADGRLIPYFLWDRNITLEELRSILDDPGHPQRVSMLALLMREARPGDVWKLVTPQDVVDAWDVVEPRLGRKQAFWTWLLAAWKDHGYFG